MNLGVHKDIIIEDNSFEMDEKDVRNFIQNISFGSI